MRNFLNNRISNYNNVGDKVDDFCEDCENRWLPFSRVWWDSTEKNIANIKRKDNGIFVIKKILSLINSISESIKDIYDMINAIEPPILSEKLIELENDYLEVGVTADDKQEDLNIAIYENYISLKNTKVNKPLIESTSDSLKIVALDNRGESVFIKSSELGKVKSVNNKIGDVILKTSDLENDSDYTTNNKLNKEIQDRISADNLKLDKPTTNNTNQFVILGDGSTAPKSDFGKVDTVNNLTPDVNKNINIGLKEVLSIDNEDLSQSINVSTLKTTSNLEEDVYKNKPTSLTLGYSMTGFTTIDDVKYTTDGSIIDFSDNRTGRSLMLLPDTLKYQNVTLILPTEKSGVLALTSDIKVKTVNDLEPDEEGNIDLGLIPAEFVKNGLGWSLKYAIDNPAKYEPTGLNAINLSKAYSDSTTMLGASGKDSTAIGAYTLAKGNNSTAIGWSSKSYGSQSLAIGYSNISYSAFSTVIGGQANIIGIESEISTPISGQNTRASIFGGQNNKIINGRYATIVGGYSNTITATSKYNITSNPLGQNSILGGNSNTITDAENSAILGGNSNSIIGHKVERNWAITVAGGENIGKGSYSSVFGYRNKSITQGETLVGMLSVTQDEALLPNTYYPSSRMFGVGVGNLVNDVTEVRKDGFNVYQNGLVTAPSLTTSLIEANNKAVTTKEYLDIRIPKPPTTGEYTLKSINGVVSWVLN